jgi:hypothetical protein
MPFLGDGPPCSSAWGAASVPGRSVRAYFPAFPASRRRISGPSDLRQLFFVNVDPAPRIDHPGCGRDRV